MAYFLLLCDIFTAIIYAMCIGHFEKEELCFDSYDSISKIDWSRELLEWCAQQELLRDIHDLIYKKFKTDQKYQSPLIHSPAYFEAFRGIATRHTSFVQAFRPFMAYLISAVSIAGLPNGLSHLA